MQGSTGFISLFCEVCGLVFVLNYGTRRKRIRGFALIPLTLRATLPLTFRATFFAVALPFFATDLVLLATALLLLAIDEALPAATFFIVAFFIVALRVPELPFPIAADVRFATALFVVGLVDFVRLLATCRVTRFFVAALLGVLFFEDVFFAVAAFTDLADFFLGEDFFEAAFVMESAGGVTVEGATSTGPATGATSVDATVLKSFDGVVEASADSEENAPSDPSESAAIVSPTAVRRMRRDVLGDVRFSWERTGIHLYFL